jgi:hypothetical protein
MMMTAVRLAFSGGIAVCEVSRGMSLLFGENVTQGYLYL